MRALSASFEHQGERLFEVIAAVFSPIIPGVMAGRTHSAQDRIRREARPTSPHSKPVLHLEAMASALLTLVSGRKVVVCAGSGGVGKTTVAAALSLGAAGGGRRVLCLTIDPARRLANSLGIENMTQGVHRIDPERLVALGYATAGELSVMMLDTKTVFDHLIEKHAKSAELRDRILSNKLYQSISTHLVGVQSYMSMEKVLEVTQDPRFDLIVLDTPPTTEALDFLRAPERLMEALDSPAMRWLVQAFEPKRAFGFNLVARGAAFALRGLGRLTGKGFLESVAEFVTDLSALFGGFRARAAELRRAFTSPAFGYVLVTAPRESAIADAEFFAASLAAEHISVDAVVINRLHRAPDANVTLAELTARLAQLQMPLSSDLPGRILQAGQEAQTVAEEEARQVARLSAKLRALNVPSEALLRVPAMERDVHDLTALAEVAAVLLA